LEALEAISIKTAVRPSPSCDKRRGEVYMRVVADLQKANINVEVSESFVSLWRGLALVSDNSWQTAWMGSTNNPLLFVTDVIDPTPEPWQAEALEAIERHDRACRSGLGSRETTLEAWLILWFLLTHQNCKVPLGSRLSGPAARHHLA
jgi:hypothetical protein